ncbi:lectin C-type domain protein [Ostertagia ostertagi]
MMMFVYVHCCMLLLWSFYPVCYSYIDDDTIERAMEGEWVALQGSDDEALIKVAELKDAGSSFDAAESFCREHESHLTSVLSENELNFIGELVLRLDLRKGGSGGPKDSKYVNALTGLRGEAIFKWIDGSPTDFASSTVKMERTCFDVSYFLFDAYLVRWCCSNGSVRFTKGSSNDPQLLAAVSHRLLLHL